MKKSHTYILMLVLTILSLLGTACNAEGQAPTVNEVEVPNLTLTDLLQELRNTCFIYNIEGGQDPFNNEVAVSPGCAVIKGNFDYGGEVGVVYRERFFIQHKGARTKDGLEIRPVRFSGLEACNAGEQTLSLAFDKGQHVSVSESFNGQTMGKVQQNQKLEEVCIGRKEAR